MLFTNVSAVIGESVKHNLFIGIRGRKIEYIGIDEPKEKFGEKINGKDKLILSGFVNSHTHAPMTLLRGLGEDLPLEKWLKTKIFPLEDKMNEKDAYWGSMLAISEMLKGGITSFTDMYIKSESVARAAIDTGIKCNFSHGITDSGEDKENIALQMSKVDYLYKEFHNENSGKLLMDVALHAQYSTTDAAVERACEFAASKKLRMHIHLSETEKERFDCIAGTGKTPTQYFDSLGLFNLPTTAAHCVTVTDEDMSILSEKNVFAAHCPASNLKLGSGIAPIEKMRKKGINIVIGTDGAASNNSLDILRDLRLSALLQKGISQDPTVMPAAVSLNMATKCGYLSQGRADCGEIAVGKKADLCVIDLKTSCLRPTVSDILYSASRDDICMTIVDGEILYEKGEYKTIDIEKIRYNIHKVGQKFI